jgi:hypothetical protein
MLQPPSDVDHQPGSRTRPKAVEPASRSLPEWSEAGTTGGVSGAQAGSLGTSRIELPPPGENEGLLAWRRQRYDRRQQSSEWLIRGARLDAGLPAVAEPGTKAGTENWIRPPRPARCRWRVGETVGVHHSGDVDKGAHWSGIERCASIWACPVCASVVRAERASEIQSAVGNWQDQGNHLVFVTLTMRHRKSDKLAVTLDAALKAWQRICQGKSWEKFKARFGVRGYVRSVEITLGSNGWHPHIHALLFTDKPLSKPDQDALTSALFDRWLTYVTKFGGGMPTKQRGIDVRPATKDGKVVAQYLSKLQEGAKPKADQGIGKEMARFDFKTGRGASLMPFELLDASRREDDADDWAAFKLWNEYVAATKGRRAITWSKGLREQVCLEDEKSDEEILEDSEQDDLLFLIPGVLYDRMKNSPAMLALVLEKVESGELESALSLIGSLSPPGAVAA